MDIGYAVSFAFKDPDWLKKLAVGALYTLACIFIIPIPILIGYHLATMRNSLNGAKHPLPSWENAGELFSDGLKFFLVVLIYSLPIMLLYGLTIGAVIIAAQNENSPGVFLNLAQCVGFIFSLTLAMIMPAVTLQYVQHNNIGACFNFSEIFAYTRRNLGNVLLAWLSIIVATLMLQIATAVAAITVCGAIFVGLAGIPWMGAVRGNLYAQVALNDEQWGKSDKEAFFDDFSY